MRNGWESSRVADSWFLARFCAGDSGRGGELIGWVDVAFEHIERKVVKAAEGLRQRLDPDWVGQVLHGGGLQ